MNKLRLYELEGLTVEVPVYEDKRTGRAIERYPDFLKEPIYTPRGHRVLFCGTDACHMSAEASPGGCPDCGSCRHFKRAAENTWFGVCTNDHSPLNNERKTHDES